MKFRNIANYLFLISAPLFGQVEDKPFKSHYLNSERTVWIYTPEGYKAERLSQKGYPLMLVVNGENYMAGALAPAKLDELILSQDIQPLVVCYIGKGEKEDELKCDPTFSRFVAHELTPWIRQNWNVTSQPSKTVIAGEGLGGLTASFLALKNPTLFGRIYSEYGVYSWSPAEKETPEWLTKQYAKCAKLPLQFYLVESSDTQEGAFARYKETLEKKGYPLMVKEDGLNPGEGLAFLVGKSKPKPLAVDTE